MRSRIIAMLGLALAGLAIGNLTACGGGSKTTTTTAPSTFRLSSASSNFLLPEAVVNSPYGFGFQTNAGDTTTTTAVLPVTFSADKNLPPGMTLSSQGVLSGTPTQAGTYGFVVTAVDSSSTPQTTSNTYSLNVRLPGATLTRVGQSDLGGHGQNAAVSVATASASQKAYAYVGTRGSAGDCPATGIKVVDLSQITNPQLVATVGGVAGASQQRARV